MKLNKKYFLAILTTIGLQFILGINSSYAVPCEDKVDTEFNYNGTYAAPVGKVWEYLWGNTHAKYTSVEDAKNKLYDTAVRYIDNRYEGNRQECVKNVQYETNGGIELIACMNQVLANNGCDPSVFKRDGTSPRSNSSNSKSNNSSSSGSSSQSSKKANQQATNSQSSSSNSRQPNLENYAALDDVELVSAYNLAIKSNQPEKEFNALQELAKRGNSAGQFNLGVRYANGDGTEQDYAKAMYWYEQAAIKGHAGAMFNLGNMHYKGLGVTANNEAAIKWWQKAALGNDLDAIVQVGEAYFYGIGVIKNEYSANRYTEEAAKKGHPRAIENLKKFNY